MTSPKEPARDALREIAEQDARAKQDAEDHRIESRLLSAQAAKKQTDRILREADREIELLKKQLDVAQIELEIYHEQGVAQPKWMSKPPKKKGKNHGTLLLQVSDTHYGEVTDPKQMADYNAFNADIAIIRTRRMFERTIHVARNFFAGVEYDGVVLALGGDIVSGTIHDELEMTNEMTLYESVEFAHDLLRPGIEMFAEEFGKVHVTSVPGNHGRHFRKVTYKGFTPQNADTAVANWLKKHFVGEEDITFHIPMTMDADFPVYDYVFSTEHGQAFRFGGSAEIGSIGPITRGTLRKGKQMSVEGSPFDYLLVGHFHQYMPMLASTYGYSVNGSLKGYDEFARGNHFPPQEPIQALFLVTPEFGVTHQTPIFVQADRSEEGW